MLAVRRGNLDGVIAVKRYILTVFNALTFKASDYFDVLKNKINVNKLKDEIVDWIRIDDLQNDPIGVETMRTLPAKEIDGMFFEVKQGDVLVARLGPTILNQKIVIIRDIYRRTFASSEFLVLRCNENCTPDELFCVMRTKYYRNLMYSRSRGSTPSRYRLTRDDMLALPFPKMDSKTRNAAILMSSALQGRATALREAKELLAGMDKMVSELLQLPDIEHDARKATATTLKALKADNTLGAEYYHPERMAVIRALEKCTHFATMKLDDVVDFIRDSVQSAQSKKPYLGLSGVVSNTGELSGVEEVVDGQAFEYEANDVLYARLRPYLNKVLYAEKDGICSTEFHVMRVKINNVLPEYLAAVLRSSLIVRQTKHMMTGNTHPRISNDDVRNLRIPVPDKAIQQRIADELHYRKTKAQALKTQATKNWETACARFEEELLQG